MEPLPPSFGRTMPRIAVTAALPLTLAACGEEPIKPGSVSVLTRSSVTVTSVLGQYKQENSSYPATLVEKNGELVVADTLRVPAPQAQLAWYRGTAFDYSYCLETDDAHMTVSGGSGNSTSPEVDSGPCSGR